MKIDHTYTHDEIRFLEKNTRHKCPMIEPPQDSYWDEDSMECIDVTRITMLGGNEGDLFVRRDRNGVFPVPRKGIDEYKLWNGKYVLLNSRYMVRMEDFDLLKIESVHKPSGRTDEHFFLMEPETPFILVEKD